MKFLNRIIKATVLIFLLSHVATVRVFPQAEKVLGRGCKNKDFCALDQTCQANVCRSLMYGRCKQNWQCMNPGKGKYDHLPLLCYQGFCVPQFKVQPHLPFTKNRNNRKR